MVILSSILYNLPTDISLCWTVRWVTRVQCNESDIIPRSTHKQFRAVWKQFTFIALCEVYIIVFPITCDGAHHVRYTNTCSASVYLRNWIVSIVRCLPQYVATQSCKSGWANKNSAQNCWLSSNVCIVFMKDFPFRAAWLPRTECADSLKDRFFFLYKLPLGAVFDSITAIYMFWCLDRN